MHIDTKIDAHQVFIGNAKECARLYRIYILAYGGSFARIQKAHTWKRASMLLALRRGKAYFLSR